MRPRILRAISITLVVIVAAVAGCDRRPAVRPFSPATDELSIMSFNLDTFAYADRDADGQADEFKPDEQVRAIAAAIARLRPDIVALQEVGSENALGRLQEEVTTAGHALPHHDFVPSPDGGPGLALLSRHYIRDRQHVTNLQYRIKDHEWPVSRGFLQVDIETGSDRMIRVINVHLKSKTFHASGQTEMRRNEARLLAAEIRKQHEQPDKPSLIVCGDFGDAPRSASTREITGDGSTSLRMLEITDEQGHAWTTYDGENENWGRHHFIFADGDMAVRFRQDRSGIPGDPALSGASRHRPLVAVFSAED